MVCRRGEVNIKVWERRQQGSRTAGFAEPTKRERPLSTILDLNLDLFDSGTDHFLDGVSFPSVMLGARPVYA